MPRKNKGERVEAGIYRLPSGEWRIRVRVAGRDRETTHRGSLESARGARAQLRREAESGARGRSARRLPKNLRGYVARWIAGKKAEGVRASTLDSYGVDLARASFVLGDLPMQEVTRSDVLDLRNMLAEEYAPKTVNGTIRVLGMLYREAVIEYDLRRSPCDGVKLLRAPPKHDEDNPGTLTAEELRRVLSAAEEASPGFTALLTTLALTGARIGEALALRADDIDEARGLLWIRRGQDKRGNICPTKTGSKRSVPLTPALLAVLRAHREDMLRTQNRSYAQGWLFGSGRKRKAFPFGGPFTRKPIAEALKRALAAAGLKGRITLHGFRRTLNSLMVEAAVDPIVTRSITGHVTEEMREHYAHVRPETKADALGAVLSLVKG